MRAVTTAESIEALTGTPSPLVLLKAVAFLDEGCRDVLAHAPIAGLGFRDRDGVPHSTFAGGTPGFARSQSPDSLSFLMPPGPPHPARGSDASMLFLLPGAGETLRLNGVVEDVTGDRVTVGVREAWVHCARAVLRARLWDAESGDAETAGADAGQAAERPRAGEGPLGLPAVAGFLARSPFLIVSSRDQHGHGDTSPKGDPPGFARILDECTLAVPDRLGNKRADTFHNLVTCDAVSLAALVPGRDDVLHLSGTAQVSDDPRLLSAMALKGKPPHAALVVRVQHAAVRRSDAVRTAALWDPAARAGRPPAPDLAQVAARHLAGNQARGSAAAVTRALSKGMAAAPRLTRRAMDASYRRELRQEGYEVPGH
jgi:predicted pyridoxine 5'-phosphate oxidase superfamily flavin-nucleotide-binding protein